jgi:hypothetical protein
VINNIGGKMKEKTFKTVSDLYGSEVCFVTIDDYRAINPDGDFRIYCDEIREYKTDQFGDETYEILAKEEK